MKAAAVQCNRCIAGEQVPHFPQTAGPAIYPVTRSTNQRDFSMKAVLLALLQTWTSEKGAGPRQR
jgi:hypothetical protein